MKQGKKANSQQHHVAALHEENPARLRGRAIVNAKAATGWPRVGSRPTSHCQRTPFYSLQSASNRILTKRFLKFTAFTSILFHCAKSKPRHRVKINFTHSAPVPRTKEH